MRIGFGYDIHPLIKGRKLILGGVEIPRQSRGLAGWSDGDVFLHAVMDALLGAAGKRDIGHYFPANDPKYKGISSLILLRKVFEIISQDGYEVNNLDATIVVETPSISPYVERMKKKLAKVLNLKENQIGIKATTNEKLGAIGEGKAIACFAVALLT